MAALSFKMEDVKQGSQITMDDCSISDKDFYWFNTSNAQTTVDAMMEAEVNEITSAIVSGVVDAEVAKRISDGLPEESNKQDSNDTPKQIEPINANPIKPTSPDNILHQTKKDVHCEQDDDEALVAVARVVEETCNQIERQNELAKSTSSDNTNTQASDCVPMDVDKSTINQCTDRQPVDSKQAGQQESEQKNASNLQPISETQASSSSTNVAVVAVVSPDNDGLAAPKADKSADLDDDIEYVVENILDKKSDSNGLAKFLVKWENYPSDSNSWEPVENLVDCEKVMTKYELKRAERLAKIYGPNATERPLKGGAGGGVRDKHKVYKVVDIMGLTQVKEEKYFLVSLADDMGSTFIRSSLAHRLFPSKVIDFYMQHIKWKSTTGRS